MLIGTARHTCPTLKRAGAVGGEQIQAVQVQFLLQFAAIETLPHCFEC